MSSFSDNFFTWKCQEVLVAAGDVHDGARTVMNRYGLLVNEGKKTDFAAAEATRNLNRLLRFKKGQQENAAALPEMDLTHSMASLAALVKYLSVS